MGVHREIRVYKIFSAANATGNTITSTVEVDCGDVAQNGFFSIHMDARASIAGASLSASYEISNTGTSYITPTGATNIFTDFNINSGPRSDGVDIFSFTPPLSRFLRILVWETQSNRATFTADLAVQ